jgi:hypothetical protein
MSVDPKEKYARSIPTLDMYSRNGFQYNVKVTEENPIYVSKVGKMYIIKGVEYTQEKVEYILRFFSKRIAGRSIYIVKKTLMNKVVEDNWISIETIIDQEVSKILSAPKLKHYIANKHISTALSDVRRKDILKRALDKDLQELAIMNESIETSKISVIETILHTFGHDTNFDEYKFNTSAIKNKYPLLFSLSYNSSTYAVKEYVDMVYLQSQQPPRTLNPNY